MFASFFQQLAQLANDPKFMEAIYSLWHGVNNPTPTRSEIAYREEMKAIQDEARSYVSIAFNALFGPDRWQAMMTEDKVNLSEVEMASIVEISNVLESLYVKLIGEGYKFKNGDLHSPEALP